MDRFIALELIQTAFDNRPHKLIVEENEVIALYSSESNVSAIKYWREKESDGYWIWSKIIMRDQHNEKLSEVERPGRIAKSKYNY